MSLSTKYYFLSRPSAASPSASKVDASPFRSPRGLDGAEQCVDTAKPSRLKSGWVRHARVPGIGVIPWDAGWPRQELWGVVIVSKSIYIPKGRRCKEASCTRFFVMNKYSTINRYIVWDASNSIKEPMRTLTYIVERTCIIKASNKSLNWVWIRLVLNSKRPVIESSSIRLFDEGICCTLCGIQRLFARELITDSDFRSYSRTPPSYQPKLLEPETENIEIYKELPRTHISLAWW